ncbi:MAG TPA: hypothetical protein VJZ71_01765 [Phycisphaerae bacterium]|nr:hypothetical protein [Phycisphaerae bacterium]
MSRRRVLAGAALTFVVSLNTARADDWQMHFCVDNFFDVYYGTATATAGYLGGGNNNLTTFFFSTTGRAPTDFLYVAAVSDQLGDQGFLGVFSNTTLGRTIQTGGVVWSVFPAGGYPATNPFFPNPWPIGTLPTQAQVNAAIAYATLNDLWVDPADPDSKVNDGTVFGGMRANIPVSANWIWHNSGLGPDPNNPLHGGFNHDEFLVFRIPGRVPAETQRLTGSVPGTFLDISTSGTLLSLNDDDEVVINTTVGNAAFPAGTVVVANNGGLGFPAVPGENDLDSANAPLPATGAFNGRQSAIAFWDDLKGDDFALRGGKNGGVYCKEVGTVLVVQWHDRPVVSSLRGSGTVRFQIQIYGGVPVGPGSRYAEFVYGDVNQPAVDGGAEATIGYQAGISGFADFQVSHNTPAAVSNGSTQTARVPMGGADWLGRFKLMLPF